MGLSMLWVYDVDCRSISFQRMHRLIRIYFKVSGMVTELMYVVHEEQ